MTDPASSKKGTNRLRLASLFGSVLALGAVGVWALSHREPPHVTFPISDMLKAADPKVGEELAVGCAACHSFQKNGPAKVGPNLFNIVGAPIARRSDYAYSDSLLALQGKHWTPDELYDWIRDPSAYAPGTKMSFVGMLDPQDRMDLIAYLMTLKD